jgi:hypothetical protein
MFRVIDPSRNKIAADPCESFTQMGETQMTAIDTACGWLPPVQRSTNHLLDAPYEAACT